MVIASTLGLFFVSDEYSYFWLGLVLLAAGAVFQQFAQVSYNAMLPQISNPGNIGNPKLGSDEVWTVINGGGGWVHPMHMHMEEHTVLIRENHTNIHPDDTGKEDVVNLDPGEHVTFFRRFRTFTGPYVAHCHNLAHEDHAMMFGWEIMYDGRPRPSLSTRDQ